MNINPNASHILDRLEEFGYESYIVGGCVRDMLMGKIPSDWDICTTAIPEEIKFVFSEYKTVDIGMEHGTVSVIMDGESFEITTMRTESDYADNRRPSCVQFVKSIELDLSRRDFTVNAIAYSPKRGLVDVFGGDQDIKNGIIKCVGEPDKRFLEDGLRIMRAIRFSSVLGFSIDEKTKESISRNKGILKNISRERIQIELVKLLMGEPENVLLEYSDVICEIIPELSLCIGFYQNTKHHSYDVYTHIVKSVSNAEKDELLRVVMLLHDIAKPLCCQTDFDGTTHFKGHDAKSAEIAGAVLKGLRFSRDFTVQAVNIIKYHDLRTPTSRRAVRRAISKIGAELFPILLDVQYADTLAQSMYLREEKLDRISKIRELYYEIIADADCIKISDLEIDGNDLIKLGYSGKEIGDLLTKALDAVIGDEIENDKKTLLKFIKGCCK